MHAAGFVLVEDVATAVSGAFNAGYFARYWLRRSERRAKRRGAFALVLIGLAATTEALFSQGLLHLHDQLVALGDLSDAIWALARLPLLLATAFITTIVLRRMFPLQHSSWRSNGRTGSLSRSVWCWGWRRWLRRDRKSVV